MCHLCKTKPVYEFTNKRKVCKTCYIRWFEKKFLYTIRKFEMLKKGDVVFYEEKKDFRNIVLEEVLKIVSKKGFVEITKKKKNNIAKFAIPLTIDFFSYEIINELINGNIGKIKNNQKIIFPLRLFLDKEVELYAKLKGLKFEKDTKFSLFNPARPTQLRSRQSRSQINEQRKFFENKVVEFIDELEIKHPEIKRAIVNGVLT